MDGEWLAVGTTLVYHNILNGQTQIAPFAEWNSDAQIPAVR
ncbi:MAG: hypothetical protein ACI841_005172, partial [Planctomycetota bacterium]